LGMGVDVDCNQVLVIHALARETRPGQVYAPPEGALGFVPSAHGGQVLNTYNYLFRSRRTPIETPAVLKKLDLLAIAVDGAVAQVSLNRPAKRNAISDVLIAQLHTCF